MAQAVENEITPAVTASFLQEHSNVQVMLDAAAAESLTRFRSPWIVGPVKWDGAKIRQAVISLAPMPMIGLSEGAMNRSSIGCVGTRKDQRVILDSCFHPSGKFEEFRKEEIEQSIPERSV